MRCMHSVRRMAPAWGYLRGVSTRVQASITLDPSAQCSPHLPEVSGSIPMAFQTSLVFFPAPHPVTGQIVQVLSTVVPTRWRDENEFHELVSIIDRVDAFAIEKWIRSKTREALARLDHQLWCEEIAEGVWCEAEEPFPARGLPWDPYELFEMACGIWRRRVEYAARLAARYPEKMPGAAADIGHLMEPEPSPRKRLRFE